MLYKPSKCQLSSLEVIVMVTLRWQAKKSWEVKRLHTLPPLGMFGSDCDDAKALRAYFSLALERIVIPKATIPKDTGKGITQAKWNCKTPNCSTTDCGNQMQQPPHAKKCAISKLLRYLPLWQENEGYRQGYNTHGWPGISGKSIKTAASQLNENKLET